MKKLFLAAAIFAASLAVSAQERTIAVRGSGTQSAACDSVVLSMSVQTKDPRAEAAVKENAEKVSAVLAALKKVGVPQKDVSTENYSLYREQNYDEAKRRSVPGDYCVTNGITAKVAVFANVGEVIDAAIAAGVNQFSHIEWVAGDREEALRLARIEAVKNAFTSAQTLCEAAGVKRGRVLSMEDGASSPARREVFAAAKANGMSEDAATPISAASVQVTATVTIVFAIE